MSRELRPYEPGAAYEPAQAPVQHTIELRRLLAAVRRQRWTILVPAVLLGVLGLAYGMSQPRTYTASATLLLDGGMNNSIRQVGGIDGRSLPEETIENARVVLNSDKLAYDVLDVTQLDQNAAFVDPPRSTISTAIGQVVGTILYPMSWLRQQVSALVSPAPPVQPDAGVPGPEAGSAAEPVDPARRIAAMRLQGGIGVYRMGRSSAVALTFTTTDPTHAATVANAYADAYTQDILSSNAQAVGQTNTWMVGRLDDLRRQAQEAADAAERFATENELSTNASGALLGEQAQGELNARLTEAIGERARAQAILEIYDNAVDGGVAGLESGNPLSIGGDVSETLRARLDTYNDVTARLQQLIENSGPNHPQVAGLRQTLSSAAERLFIELQARRQDAATELRVAEERVNALRRSLDEVRGTTSGQAAALNRLRALQQEADTLSTLYQATLTRAQEIEQQQSFPVSNVRVLSYAQVPTAPSGPASRRTAVAAGLLGLFFGMAMAALREGRENFLRTGQDVTDYSGLRFLGHLPVLGRARPVRVDPARLRITKMRDPDAGGGRLPVPSRPILAGVTIPVLQHPDSLYAETLRHVRLAASSGANAVPMTGITSFHPYAGRATVTLNLAGQIAASSSRRVLLIDTDSRDGRLSRMLGLAEKPGLSDVAAGDTDWRAMLFDVKHSHLTVLPCGLTTSGASDDLMVAQALRRILSELGEEFGHVVLDVPPLYPVAQGLAIVRELPGYVIVAEWGKTPRDMVDTVLGNHPELEANCLGVVYDRMVPRRLRSFLMPGSVEHMLVASGGAHRRG